MSAPRDNWRNPATAWLPPDVERTDDERWIDWPAEELPAEKTLSRQIALFSILAQLWLTGLIVLLIWWLKS